MRRSVTMGLILSTVVVTGAWATAEARLPHERKEVAGLAVVFGAEPEPALDGEVQFLRWRVTTLAGNTAYADMKSAEVVIKHEGTEYGPFVVQGVRSDPGLYQTRHIFTAPGQYQSVLRFRKGEETVVNTIDFNFRINDRHTLELPPKPASSR